MKNMILMSTGVTASAMKKLRITASLNLLQHCKTTSKRDQDELRLEPSSHKKQQRQAGWPKTLGKNEFFLKYDLSKSQAEAMK